MAECGAGEAGLGCGSEQWSDSTAGVLFLLLLLFGIFSKRVWPGREATLRCSHFLTHSLGLPSKKQKEVRWSLLIQVGSTETVIVHQVSIVFMSQPFSGWEDSSKNLSFHFSISFFVFLSGFPTDSFELTEKPSFARLRSVRSFVLSFWPGEL